MEGLPTGQCVALKNWLDIVLLGFCAGAGGGVEGTRVEGSWVLPWAELSPHTRSGAQNPLQPQIHQYTPHTPPKQKKWPEISQFQLPQGVSRREKMGLRGQRAEVFLEFNNISKQRKDTQTCRVEEPGPREPLNMVTE